MPFISWYLPLQLYKEKHLWQSILSFIGGGFNTAVADVFSFVAGNKRWQCSGITNNVCLILLLALFSHRIENIKKNPICLPTVPISYPFILLFLPFLFSSLPIFLLFPFSFHSLTFFHLSLPLPIFCFPFFPLPFFLTLPYFPSASFSSSTAWFYSIISMAIYLIIYRMCRKHRRRRLQLRRRE